MKGSKRIKTCMNTKINRRDDGEIQSDNGSHSQKQRKRTNYEKHKIPVPHKLSYINRSGGHKIALLPCITCTQRR